MTMSDARRSGDASPAVACLNCTNLSAVTEVVDSTCPHCGGQHFVAPDVQALIGGGRGDLDYAAEALGVSVPATATDEAIAFMVAAAMRVRLTPSAP